MNKRKKKVDYFPHYVKPGKTLAILEKRWGNDGYAFWFKLLEILCETDGHCLDCSDSYSWEYLTAKAGVDGPVASQILDLLASLEKIDPILWQYDRKIWCEDLVSNLSVLYRKRAGLAPERPISCFEVSEKVDSASNPARVGPQNEQTGAGNPQSKAKESKAKERITAPQSGADSPPIGGFLKIPDELKQEWEKTLAHYGRRPNWIRDEAPLLRVVQSIKDPDRIRSALIGFRNEQKTERYDPSKHLDLHRLLSAKSFGHLEGLGEPVDPGAQSGPAMSDADAEHYRKLKAEAEMYGVKL